MAPLRIQSVYVLLSAAVPWRNPTEWPSSWHAVLRLFAASVSWSGFSRSRALLATLPPDGRPPDMLGMARAMKLMALATELAGAEWAAVA